MNPEQLEGMSPKDRKMMGIKPESEGPSEEGPISKEGLLNRNFGKKEGAEISEGPEPSDDVVDPNKPFSEKGLLNRNLGK